MRKYNIAQIGSFDVENYGDLLFPIILENELQKRVNLNEIFLFSPNGGEQPFFKNKVYPVKELENIIRKKNIDAIIIGGGDLIRLDNKITANYEKKYDVAIEFWQLPILLGKKYNIPVIFNAPGVPFKFTEEQKSIVDILLETIEYISLRDETSKKILSNTYEGIINVVPDTINLIPNFYSKEKLSENLSKLRNNKIIPFINNYIVIQTRIIYHDEERYIEELKKLVNYITNEEKKEVLIVPIGYVHNDIAFSEKLLDKNNKKIFIIKKKLHPFDMLTIFANSDGFIGTSLHGILTSNAYEVPIYALNTENLVKITGFLKLIKKEKQQAIEINDITFNYKRNFKKQDFKSNKAIIEMDNKHFDKIAEIIKNHKIKESVNLEEKILDTFYTNIDFLKLQAKNNQIKQENYQNLLNENRILKNEIDSLKNSNSFKITAPLRKIKSIISKKKGDNIIYINNKSRRLKKINKKIGIQIHIFHLDLLQNIRDTLIVMPYEYDCLISTDTKQKKKEIENFFENNKLKNVNKVIIDVFENRGRDIYPFIEQLKENINEYDYICHIHTKKSIYADYGDDWRNYLYYNLFGTRENIESIFYFFESNNIGLIYPKTFDKIEKNMQMGSCEKEFKKLKIKLNIVDEFKSIFPSGSMFWAKKEILYPLIKKLNKKDFPKESGQVDGTVAHAIERSFCLLSEKQGFEYLQIKNDTKIK